VSGPPGMAVAGRDRRREDPPDRIAPEEAIASRRRRAAEEPLDVRLTSRAPFVRLEVRNPLHRTSYAVVFPDYPRRTAAMCTCTDFARRGLGSCKHLEAGWSWLEERKEADLTPSEGPAPVPDLWPEIDRRLDALRREGAHSIRDIERAGAALVEEPPAVPGGAEKPVGEEVGRRSRRRGPTRSSRARP